MESNPPPVMSIQKMLKTSSNLVIFISAINILFFEEYEKATSLLLTVIAINYVYYKK